MSTRSRCSAPAPSTASWAASSASWRGPPSSLDRGEASRGLRERSIAGPPTSIPKPRDEVARDRRNARMDAVGGRRAFDRCDVNSGAQTLTVSNEGLAPRLSGAILIWLRASTPASRKRTSVLYPHNQRASIASQASTMAVALPRQTIASAATGAPRQLPYKQKIPTEPKTRAIAVSATRDRRTAKLMLAMIKKDY
jgi:hypothetical protein